MLNAHKLLFNEIYSKVKYTRLYNNDNNCAFDSRQRSIITTYMGLHKIYYMATNSHKSLYIRGSSLVHFAKSLKHWLTKQTTENRTTNTV